MEVAGFRFDNGAANSPRMLGIVNESTHKLFPANFG
jgi:hypothetical protein